MQQLQLHMAEAAPPHPRAANVPIYRVVLVRESAIADAPRPQLRSSHNCAALLQTYLSGADREHFVVLMLDRKNKLIGINTVSIGSLTASVVHPREVFKPAIVANAAAIICGHNHPSGDPTPSQEDRAMTTRLVKGGTLLGIQVLDHVIIGDRTHYSFADESAL